MHRQFYRYWLVRLLTPLALMSGTGMAHAAANWVLSTACTGGGAVTSISCSTASPSTSDNFTISGYSTAPGTAGTKFSSAYIYEYGSDPGQFGVVKSTGGGGESSGTTGAHATDNINGTDLFMFNFTTATSLTDVKIGWNGTDNASGSYTDSDLSVFAWTGGGAPTDAGTKNITNQTEGTLVGSGWALVGNFANVGDSSAFANNTATFSSSIYSSYWLVSAYNTSYGSGLSGGNDAFKLVAFGGVPCSGGNCGGGGGSAPEPGSMALVGLAVLGLLATRRKLSAAKRH